MQGWGDAGLGVRVVREYASLIPRSRNMKNQIKARFSQEPNKKIIFKLYRIQTKSDSNKKITKPDSNKSQKKG
jgi:hypothetical protein